MDANTLAQRLENAEKSIQFLQREHASTLVNLHEEIAKWQQKCSDLTFQLAIGGTVINTADDRKLRTTIEQLENESHQREEKIKGLHKLLEEKETLLNSAQTRLTVNERKHALELHVQHEKQRELKMELEQRATLIAQLTHQIHQEKQRQENVCNRIRLGQIILPNKPTNLKNNDGQQQQSFSPIRHLSNRSSSLSNRTGSDQESAKVLFIGRRPPTPPQQLRALSSKGTESNDEHFYTKRQRQLLNNHAEYVDFNHVASSRPTSKLSIILPPILNRKIPPKPLATTTLQQEEQA